MVLDDAIAGDVMRSGDAEPISPPSLQKSHRVGLLVNDSNASTDPGEASSGWEKQNTMSHLDVRAQR
jgi:hypothetical protein